MKRKVSIIIALSLMTLWSGTAEAQVKFFSDFECGRLGSASLKDSTNIYARELVYDIVSAKDPDNPVDTLLEPSSRWFYFLMTGVKGKDITLKFIDTDPWAPFYSYDNREWTRYDPENEMTGKFTARKTYDRDSVWVAYCIPYTNTHLNQMMDEWQYRNGVRVYSIGKSYQGRDMNMLVITNHEIPDKNKKRIYIHGRVHPSESPCSWCLEGLIEELISPTPYARSLRDQAVFYILPFNNPDGVALGHSRCDAIGVNMEINYDRPDSLTRPEVKNIKKFIETTTWGGNHFDLFLNFHSQIAPHMTYWVHTEESTSPLYFKKEQTLTSLTISNNPMFAPDMLSYSKMAPRYIEGYFWNNAGENTLAITHETPYSYYDRNEKGIIVTKENLKWMGKKTLWAVAEYLGIGSAGRIVVEPHKASHCTKSEDLDHVYTGDHYYVAEKDGAIVSYKHKKLPAGTYEVYRWKVGAKATVNAEGENCWEKLSNYTQDDEGTMNISIQLSEGQRAGSLLLVKTE
ncbi:MAG: hypothetical protein II157_02475 [Bacteroidales bacterium]|nr:hypothetical protein [Bacteroidales bacterium]